MKNVFSFVFVLSFFSSQLIAAERYSLQQAREKVVNDNVKVSIAYQQYVLVQNESRAKTLSILPSIQVDLLILNYQYSILRSIIPEPSRFFEASAQKDLMMASKINKIIVQKNLLEDLEKTFFLFQFHNEMVNSLKHETDISNEIAMRSKEAYELGAIDFSEFYKTQRNVIENKTQVVNGNEIVDSEEFALKLILQVKNNNDPLKLDKLNFYNESLDWPISAIESAQIAVNNSKEIEQYDHLIDAARKQRNGVVFSWISWGGVGFDYFAKLSIANLEIEKIELMKKKAIIEIKNQAADKYSQIEFQKEKIMFQEKLLDMSQAEYGKAIAVNDNLLKTFINLKKAELNLIYAQRENSKLKYELELKYIQFKRLLGTNMMTNIVPRS